MSYSHCYYITAGSLVHECIRLNAFDCCCRGSFHPTTLLSNGILQTFEAHATGEHQAPGFGTKHRLLLPARGYPFTHATSYNTPQDGNHNAEAAGNWAGDPCRSSLTR